MLEACVEKIRQLREQHGRPVSLVGWSLGGVYARELAKMMPDDVRLVITLGSPFTGSHKATNAWRVYQLVSGEKEIDEARFAALRENPARADHLDLQPHRRRRRLAVQRGAGNGNVREHRSACQPCGHGPQSDRPVRDRRPAVAAGRTMEAL
ncbi:GPI inositol-deacylase [Massilia sp. B-10]|nr:GPI inositol-deacylase [Massilia sp. B-10]